MLCNFIPICCAPTCACPPQQVVEEEVEVERKEAGWQPTTNSLQLTSDDQHS